MANEKLLIDKERLREVLLRYLNAPHMRFRDRALMRIAVRACISYLDSQRPVDAVEVVRCKDCIHYDFGVCLKIYSDGAVSQYAWQARKENDFCSYGERKEDGKE